MNNLLKGDYLSVLEEKGVITFVPSGFSMWPFIKNRSQTVIIQKISAPLKMFDVVFYKRADGSLVLHRIIEVGQDFFIVRGDSQRNYTERINKQDVLGVMTGFYKGKKLINSQNEKYLKRVKRWYKNGFFTKLKLKLFYLKLKKSSKKGA